MMRNKDREGYLPGLALSGLSAVLAVPLTLGILAITHRRFCKLDEMLFVLQVNFVFFLAGGYFVGDFWQRREPWGALLRAGILGVVAGLSLNILLSNVFGADNRGKQKFTMAEMRRVADAIETLKTPDGLYPKVTSIADVQAAARRALPSTDGWGSPFVVRSEGGSYVIVSPAECGRFEQVDPWKYQPAKTSDYSADIVLQNGSFTRSPEGVQR